VAGWVGWRVGCWMAGWAGGSLDGWVGGWVAGWPPPYCACQGTTLAVRGAHRCHSPSAQQDAPVPSALLRAGDFRQCPAAQATRAGLVKLATDYVNIHVGLSWDTGVCAVLCCAALITLVHCLPARCHAPVPLFFLRGPFPHPAAPLPCNRLAACPRCHPHPADEATRWKPISSKICFPSASPALADDVSIIT
jgi:hypothetical protein